MRLRASRGLLHLLLLVGLLFPGLSAFGNDAPEYLAPGATGLLRAGGSPHDVDLRTLFRDPDVLGTAVRVSVRLGATTKNIDLALFDQDKPITVANFLAYVNSGNFAANFIHRSVPNFVIQGGGFAWSAANQILPVPTFAKIQNEPGLSNLRGTIAMAKLADDPDSATSQWFINLADNSANLDAQNGGFTVFGRVLGDGMAVADEVAALPRYNAGAPFDTLPLKDYPTGAASARPYTVDTNVTIIPALSFTASSSDPALVSLSATGTTLHISPAANRSGTATLTLTATDLDGATTQGTITVTVLAQAVGWHVASDPAGPPTAFTLDPSDQTLLAQDPVPISWGGIAFGGSESRTFTVTNSSTLPLVDFAVTATGQNAADFTVTSGAGPATLGPGESTTVTVSFAPGAHGSRSASLRLASPDIDAPSLTLALTGSGLDTSAPTLSPVSSQTVFAGSQRTATIPDFRGALVTASDDVGVVTFTQTPAPGSVQLLGSYVLSFSAADAAGNVATAQGTLTVSIAPEAVAAVALSSAYGGAPAPIAGGGSLPTGSTLTAFGTPAISDARDLAARATVAAGRAKLAAIYWENASGQNKLVALQGQPSGVSGANFKSFRDPLLAPGGAIAFGATLTGPKASEDEGVWTDLFGPLALLLRENAELPGLHNLKLKSVTSLALTDDAVVALVKLVHLPNVVTAADDTALVRVTGPASSIVLARTGVFFDGSSIKKLSVLQPAARSVGQGRWLGASDVLANLTLQDKRTVLVRLAADGSQTALLQSGLPDLHFPARLATLGLPAMGGSGVVLLATKAVQPGVTKANDSTLLSAAAGDDFTEAISEEAGAGNFSVLSDPVANDQGTLLFWGTKRSAAAGLPATTALWTIYGATPPGAFVRLNDPVVDATGALAGGTWKSFTTFALPDGPDAGPVFVAQVGGVPAAKKLGLWAAVSSGGLRQLLRTGDDITFPTGPKRLTAFTLLNSLPGSFGARRSYNATGSLAIQATFLDHTQALLRIDIP